MAKVDADAIPFHLKRFISYAEKWGEQDIDDRERLVENATLEELQDLASLWGFCIGPISEWLGEPHVRAAAPTDEYVAFTCLILATDSARRHLKRLGKEL